MGDTMCFRIVSKSDLDEHMKRSAQDKFYARHCRILDFIRNEAEIEFNIGTKSVMFPVIDALGDHLVRLVCVNFAACACADKGECNGIRGSCSNAEYLYTVTAEAIRHVLATVDFGLNTPEFEDEYYFTGLLTARCWLNKYEGTICVVYYE